MAGGEPQITRAHLPDDFMDDLRCQEPVLPAAAVAEPAVADTPVPCALAHPDPDPELAAPPVAEAGPQPSLSDAGTMHEQEIRLIQAALTAAGGNISAASKRLGISRNTIYRKLRWNTPAGGMH
jgi:transcriptional regulator of acetoin/glycerol metabolism